MKRFSILLILVLFVSAISAISRDITITLKNCDGSPAGGGRLYVWTNTGEFWVNESTTPGTFTLSSTSPSISYRMHYGAGSEKYTGLANIENPEFTLYDYTVNLKDCSAGLLAGGRAYIWGNNGEGWISGFTSSEAGVTTKLLPGSYNIRMHYGTGSEKVDGLAVAKDCETVQSYLFTAYDYTVNLKDCSAGLLAGGRAYIWGNNGEGWISGFTSSEAGVTTKLLPGSYNLRMHYGTGSEKKDGLLVSANCNGQSYLFTAYDYTVDLKDCSAELLAGGRAYIWGNNGEGWISGYTSTEAGVTTKLLPGSYNIRMHYGTGSEKVDGLAVANNCQANQTYAFTAYDYTVNLKDCSTNPLAGGRAYIWGNNGEGWISGYTSTEAGVTTKLLPGSYNVRMHYKTGSQKWDGLVVDADCEVEQSETFTAKKVSLSYESGIYMWGNNGESWFAQPSMNLLPGSYNLRYGSLARFPFEVVSCFGAQASKYTGREFILRFIDSKGIGIADKTVQMHVAGKWEDIEEKTDIYGNIQYNLPTGVNATYFRIQNFNGGSQQIYQDISKNNLVIFQTVGTTVKLVDHTGADLNADAPYDGLKGRWRWHQTAWSSNLNANVDAIELLPGSYYFDMTYNGGKQQVGQLAISSANKVVTFTTVETSVTLKDIDGTPLSGSFRWHQWAWCPSKLANVDVLELLPGNYYFDMNFNGGKQQVGQLAISGATYNVAFTTVRTTVSLEDKDGNALAGIYRFHQSAWSSNFNANVDVLELLPGSYYFDMVYNGGKQQVGPLPVSGATYEQAFKTIRTHFTLNSIDGNLAGGKFQWHQSAWSPALTTTVGDDIQEFLPGNYYFKMTYNNAWEQLNSAPLASYVDEETSEAYVEFATGRVRYNPTAGVKCYHKTRNTGGWFTITQNPTYLLTGDYWFKFGTEQISRTIDANTIQGDGINLGGFDFTVKLIDSKGKLITYSGATLSVHTNNKWYNASMPDDGLFHGSLKPGETIISFTMRYKNSTQQIEPNVSANPLVTFQTVNVTAVLKSSTNDPLPGTVRLGTKPWTQGNTSWQDWGNANEPKELLPGNKYSFEMTYNNAKQTMSNFNVSSGNPIFQTVAVTPKLISSAGLELDGSVLYFDQKYWTSWGPANTTTKELLPGEYNFWMLYKGIREEKNNLQILASQDIIFQTTLVTCNTTMPNAIYKYQRPGDSWFVLETNPMELLQANTKFRCTSGNKQKDITVKPTGTSYTVDFGAFKSSMETEAGIYSIDDISPNPVSEFANITFHTPEECHLTIVVFDINGNVIKELFNNMAVQGTNTIAWDTRDNSGMQVANGTYFVSFNVNGTFVTQKLIIQK